MNPVRVSDHKIFVKRGCDEPTIPILLAVPHAGRIYPPNINDDLRMASDQLVRLEDRYVDILMRESISDQVPTIIATVPRAIIDLNRAEQEIDADMVSGLDWDELPHPSVKLRGGLGLIPRRLSGVGDIWRRNISRQEVDARIDNIHKPYHEMVDLILSQMVDKFGFALLLDIHSMPPLKNTMANGRIAQFVVGDRFGSSTDNIYSDQIIGFLQQQGFDVALNAPYSGGYILERHSNPQKGRHAIQLEIDRDLYLSADMREPNSRARNIGRIISSLVRHLSEEMLHSGGLEAAE